MRTVEEHQRVVAGLITARPAITVPLTSAEGLVLAADVIAPLSLPGFDNSAMDGYAVLAADVAGAGPETPVKLPVAEDIPAGRTDALTLRPGTVTAEWHGWRLDSSVGLLLVVVLGLMLLGIAADEWHDDADRALLEKARAAASPNEAA